MKWNCELIQDLLPLYEEDLCSPTSRKAVQEHLEECECCRRLTAPLPIEVPRDLPDADQAVQKSIKKVKRRWLASLLAAVLAVPLLLMGYNQYRGYGLCFTNLDDIYTGWRFLHALETEDWEKAAQMHNFSNDYENILEALANPAWFSDQEYERTLTEVGWVADLSEAQFIEEMTRRYTADLGALEDKVTFDCTGFRSAYRMADRWYVIFSVAVTQGSKTLDTEIDLRVSGGKIELAGISHKAGVQWLDVIDRALYPSAHPGY